MTELTLAPSGARAGQLSLRRVSKSYRVNGRILPVLDGIDLDVEPGEFVCVVGASGCGKSTLLRLIVGLDHDYDGEILLADERISGTSLTRGMVFQDHRLLPWLTVEENIALALENVASPAAAKQARVQQHIDLVGLAGFERAYPYQLSGGMAQRAAIARGLVGNPEILLLDEPLGALDALSRAGLQEQLRRIWISEKITMILVTHDVEEAIYLADKVVVMQPRPGRIARQFKVELPSPRDRASIPFVAVRQRILADMGRFESPAPFAAARTLPAA